jgi:broad-specificity NMP kinase
MGTLVKTHSARQLHDRSLKIIAKSLFRELRENGYDTKEIVNLSTELLSLVTSELRNGSHEAAAGQ